MGALVPMRGEGPHKRQPLAGWIAEVASETEERGANLTRLALVHVGSNGSQKSVHVCNLGAGKGWTHESLGKMFDNKALSYSQDLPGVQQFELLAFFGDRGEPEASHPFVVNGATNWGGATEGPDTAGQTRQGMRLTEAIVQGTFALLRTQHHASQDMIEMFIRERRELMTENREAFAIVKEILMQKSLDDHGRKMKELEFERSSKERQKWLALAPVLVNTVFGREVFPQSAADTALIETIAETLTEEDIAKLAAIVPPQLMGPIAARFTEVIEKKAREKAALAHATELEIMGKD